MTQTGRQPPWAIRNLATLVAVASQVIALVSVSAIMVYKVNDHAQSIERLRDRQAVHETLQHETARTLAATATLVSALAERQNHFAEDVRELRRGPLGGLRP